LKANAVEQEEFVEIFSRFLAGHPEKNMLIDIFDASTGRSTRKLKPATLTTAVSRMISRRRGSRAT